MKDNRVVCLIPSAGYGTRMGCLPHEAKELIINPSTNKPLIQWHLDLCSKYNLKPLVITRKEKTGLIDYCKKQNVDCLLVEHQEEWTNTLLMVKEHWGETNILLLPDTNFSDTSVLSNIKHSLIIESKPLVAAVHNVKDGNKWGMVNHRYTKYIIQEKPTNQKVGYAWGILGFKKECGIKLFENLKDKKVYSTNDLKIYKLQWFKDVTR